jgi:hypothetical protein
VNAAAEKLAATFFAASSEFMAEVRQQSDEDSANLARQLVSGLRGALRLLAECSTPRMVDQMAHLDLLQAEATRWLNDGGELVLPSSST